MKISKILSLTSALTMLVSQTAFAASECTLNGESIPCDQMPMWFWGVMIGMFVFMAFAGLFTLWMLIDVIKNQHEKKFMWIAIIFFFTFFGALAYYFSVKRHRNESIAPSPTGPTAPPTGPIGV